MNRGESTYLASPLSQVRLFLKKGASFGKIEETVRHVPKGAPLDDTYHTKATSTGRGRLLFEKCAKVLAFRHEIHA